MKKRASFTALLLTALSGSYVIHTQTTHPPSRTSAGADPETAETKQAAAEEAGGPAFPQGSPVPAGTGASATAPGQLTAAATPATAPGRPVLRPVPGAAAAKAFDPRFVQPATRMGAFGISEAERERLIADWEDGERAETEEAERWAKRNGWPVQGTTGDGGWFKLRRLDEYGRPAYVQSRNQEARISHNVEVLTQFGGPPGGVTINLSGNGWLAGVWDGGRPRLSHQEFNDFPGRVIYADTGLEVNAPLNSHMTHVLGTVLGNGFVDNRARGMAWRASALTFGSGNDNAEIGANGATAPDQPSKVYVSNHSYGGSGGWLSYPATHARAGSWYWAGTDGGLKDPGFGRYGSEQRNNDATCRVTPYLLQFVACGNERLDGPSTGATIYIKVPNGSGGFMEVQRTWPDPQAPPLDGAVDGGYDSLYDYGTEKNIMSVGNMKDAVSGGARSPAGVGMVASSSYGPTDDGRIKPDVAGNGEDVLSADFGSDTATSRMTGTSMASPGACGTGLLLHEHYRDKTGQYLRASTLKALMIHTATDVQTPGPDYQSGWGLIDAVAAVNHIDLHAAEPGASHVVEGVLSAEQPEFRITFTSSGLPKATLVWTDPEGAAQSGLDNRTKVLVNDLDLTIRTPSGTVYKAPQLNPLIPAATAVYDGNNTDNVEVVGAAPLQFIPPQPGVYELAVTYKGTLTEPGVTAPAIPKQDFSLMFQGNAAANTGSIAEGVDKPERAFTRHAAATASFGFETAAGATGGDRAMNLDIADSESAGCETKVTGPITVSFNWGVDSEAGYDFLRFYSDGVKIAEVSGSVASAPVVYNVPAGTHTLRWAYEKDSTVSTGADKGWLDNLEFNSLPEAVDNLALTFTQPAGSTVPWALENTTGNPGTPTNDAAKAGDVTAGQRSDMETIIQGPALVRFRMVHNAAAGVGELRAQWGPGFSQSILHSAGNTWRRYSIELAAGPQTVRWSWFKTANGSGAGRVDEVTVTPLPASLRDAADLPPSAPNLVVEDFASAPWIADISEAAPSGRLGERGAHSIHTLYTAGQNNNTAIRYPIISNLGGTVSFWWQASGAPGGNLSLQMRTSATGVFVQAGPSTGPRKIDAIPGGTAWQQVHLEIPSGYVELRWLYSATTTAGQGWLDQIQFQEGLMHPARGLDRWSSRWETYGDAPWAAVHDTTNGGVDSTSHGDIGDNQSTTMTTRVTGPKFLRFHWKADSEANYDFLRFEMDSEAAVPPISGQTGWREVTYDIPAGTHILRWIYSKDNSVSTGQDRGWVDQISLLRADWGVGALTFTGAGSVALVPAKKDPTAGFFLETSTDMTTWSEVGGMIPAHFSEVSLIVNAPGNRRFFRLLYKPEMVQTIENAGFELPATAPNSFFSNAPGWGPDNDAAGNSSFENITGFAAEGAQHLSLAAGAFSEMKGAFRGYRGVHSVSAAVGNRPGWTQPGNLSSIVLSSGPEVARSTIGAAGFASGTWQRPMPASYDSFETNLDVFYDYKVRLEGTVSRSHFDAVRIVSEPQ